MNDNTLLQATVDAPDDDHLRLVFADWLEENGQPARAEFIRVQFALGKCPPKDPRQLRLETRQEQLRKAHSNDWVVQCGLPLTWEETLGLFRRCLAEASAWCSEAKGNMRTPALQPPHLCWVSRFGRSRTTPERQAIVNTLANARTRLLVERLKTPQTSARASAAGKLLVFYPDATLFDGAAQGECADIFDVENIPAWDTWVYFVEEPSNGLPDSSYGSYLLSWVPPPFVDRVDWGIRVNPEQCLCWATDFDTTFTRRLRTAGLLT